MNKKVKHKNNIKGETIKELEGENVEIKNYQNQNTKVLKHNKTPINNLK